MPNPTDLPSHVQWLAIHRGSELAGHLADNGVRLGVEDALRVLMAADPSPGLHGVQWLHERLMSGGYLWEDVAGGLGSKAHETLVLFAQHRRNLAGPARNLDHYASLAAVYQAVAPRLVEPQPAELSGRALKREQRMQAYAESIVVHQSPELIVAVPLSVQSSQWWGQGTRWCTAAQGSNMFDHYHIQAPLIVVVMPGIQEGKLQLHMAPGRRMQFMGADDGVVDPDFVAEHWDILGRLVMWAAMRCPDMWSYVPQAQHSRELCMEMVKAGGLNLALVPSHHRDQDMCWAAVMADSGALEIVDESMRSRELCLMAVSRDGMALRHVPRQHHDWAMSSAALEQSGRSLYFVPRIYMSPSVCMQAVASSGLALDAVPTAMRTLEMCRAAVAQDGRAIKWVPPDMVDMDMCRAAVASNPASISYMPEFMLHHELVMLAVQGNGNLLNCIPGRVIDEEVCLAAVRNHPGSLSAVRQDMRSPLICMEAVQRDGDMLFYVPQDLRTEEICRAAYANDRQSYRYMPPGIGRKIMADTPIMPHDDIHDIDWDADTALAGLSRSLQTPLGGAICHVDAHDTRAPGT